MILSRNSTETHWRFQVTHSSLFDHRETVAAAELWNIFFPLILSSFLSVKALSLPPPSDWCADSKANPSCLIAETEFLAPESRDEADSRLWIWQLEQSGSAQTSRTSIRKQFLQNMTHYKICNDSIPWIMVLETLLQLQLQCETRYHFACDTLFIKQKYILKTL